MPLSSENQFFEVPRGVSFHFFCCLIGRFDTLSFFLLFFTLLYGFRSPRGRPGLSPWPPWTHLLGVKFSFRSWGLPISPKGSFFVSFGSPFGSLLGVFLEVLWDSSTLHGDWEEMPYILCLMCVCVDPDSK